MDLGQHRLQLADVELRRRRRIDTEVATGDLVTEGEPLDVEEAHGTLQIRQTVGPWGEQPLDLGPARDPEAQHID